MAEEYFIRSPDEETARGPYGIDELVTLAEAGRIDQEYYYFDPKMESWALLRSNEPLRAKVFPEKKKLVLRKKAAEEIASINTEEESEEAGAIKVDELLAAAEGHTDETAYVRNKRIWEERTAAIAVPTLAGMLIVSALSMIYPSWEIIAAIIAETEGAVAELFQRPFVFLGAADLIMGILLLLNATEIFPIIRLRAMLGGGFFSVLYLAHHMNGDPQGLWMALSSLLFAAGLFVCTLTLNFRIMIISAMIGLAGALGLAWYANLVPLLFG